MIYIDFYDANGRFVVRHTIELNEPHKYALMVAFTYCKAIFSWYKNADSALVLIDNKIREFKRHE